MAKGQTARISGREGVVTMRNHPRLFIELDDAKLLQSYNGALESVRLLRQEIEGRIKERGAVAIPSDTFLCEMPVRNTYTPESFVPLKELLSPADLATCWKATWLETTVIEHPETWDTVKVLALGRRYGGEAQRVIEGARLEGRGSLTFRRREPTR